MIKRSITDDMLNEFRALGDDDRRRVLEYARSLGQTPPKGVRGEALLAHAGVLSEEDASAISEAIDEGCEQVNLDAW